MLANLRNLSETQLLELVSSILSGPEKLTIVERAELLQINDEFTRRDAMRLRRLCHYCYKPMGEGPHCAKCGAL